MHACKKQVYSCSCQLARLGHHGKKTSQMRWHVFFIRKSINCTFSTHSTRVTTQILATARPSTEVIKKYDVIPQFARQVVY